MTLLVRKPAVLAVRNSKVTTSLRLQFKKWPRCYPRRPGICLKRLASALAKNLVPMARQESRGLAQGGRRGCQDLYFRPGAAWPIFQRIMVMQLWSHLNRLAMMKLNLPRPSGSGFNACFHENDHLQRFFQAKKHSTPGSLSPLKLCLPLQHELKAMQR